MSGADPKQREPSEFERQSAEASPGFVAEFWEFLKTNKKWWLLPIILFLVVIGLFIVLTSTPVAPFIYTLF
jgi:hypothetical protein